uniref:Uncharacterized protein n=1 Tax=Arundo donax TaxID=35708 RepID=A0A0A8YFW3_ARUDO
MVVVGCFLCLYMVKMHFWSIALLTGSVWISTSNLSKWLPCWK